MKQRQWLQLIIGFVLTSLLIDSCSFSVQVISTPPTIPSVPSSPTPGTAA